MLQKSKRLSIVLLVMLCFCLLPLIVQAGTVNFFKLPDYTKTDYYFGKIDNNTLKIFNEKDDSFLSHFYFYNFSELLPNPKVAVGPNFNFYSPATPEHLPNFPYTPFASFKFETPSDRISSIIPNNFIEFVFDDLSGNTLASLFGNHSLVAGLFVQDYMGGESAQFASVPLPASFVLLLSGLAGLVWARRRLGV